MTLVKSKSKAKLHSTQRKRSAMHHRKSRSYSKTYWPYIPIILIFGVGLALNTLLYSHPQVLGANSNFSEQSLLDDTNAQRQQYNEPNLNLSTQLTEAAQNKANDMVAKNYWSHNTPSGQTPWTFITAVGYNYQLAGENLAYGFANASDAVTGWMNSPEHRANILNAGYQDVGFGVASSPDYVGQGPEVLIVAEYARPVAGTVASISFNVPTHSSVLGTKTTGTVVSSQPSAKLVSRVQLLTGGKAMWSLTALSFITGIIVCLFIVRHLRRFKRLIIDGEQLITRHYALDIILALIITAGFILTRTSGVIR
jgi:uncharacterized protein YkwD